MKSHLLLIAAVFSLVLSSCKEEGWKPGTPIAVEQIKIGVVHITDPFSESSGYSYAHQMGIEEMKKRLELTDSQVLYKTHVDDVDVLGVENAMREFIAQGANIIIATSWGYMDVCEKLAKEFPSVVFAHASGYKHNETNFTNYFGRIYQARYLSGIVAGLKTKTNKIGYVAAWGKENGEVTGGINAFAKGVEKVNPQAKIYVKITHSWYDPMGETVAARNLIANECDIVTQHCDTPNPQIEAEKAQICGIGYNTDMSVDAPNAALTSVIWRWGAYYTTLVQSVINGTFTTKPWFGSLKDGIVDIAPLNEKMSWEQELLSILEDEKQKIKAGEFDVFDDEKLSDDKIRNGINWYHRNVIEMR